MFAHTLDIFTPVSRFPFTCLFCLNLYYSEGYISVGCPDSISESDTDVCFQPICILMYTTYICIPICIYIYLNLKMIFTKLCKFD